MYIFYSSSDGFHASTAAQANITLNGTSPSLFGESLLAEDINNDSYIDLVVGARMKNLSGGAGDRTGQIYIFYGSSDGMHSYTAAEANVTINGTAVGRDFGNTIISANIFNYGINDIIVGSIGGALGTYTGRVHILSLNLAPVLSSVPNQSWIEDTSITINLSQYISDVNSDNPNITWTSSADISVSVDESTNVMTLTPNTNWYGTEYIVFYANDTFNGLVASNNITLTVSNTADCGDAACDASETCTSCSADCGACAATPGSSSETIAQSGYTFAEI